MGEYKVKIYSHAKIDFREIVSYLNTLSPQAALKYYDLITESIGSLSEMPERCPFVRPHYSRIISYALDLKY
jgi:plasmid stabilization system protein ParE